MSSWYAQAGHSTGPVRHTTNYSRFDTVDPKQEQRPPGRLQKFSHTVQSLAFMSLLTHLVWGAMATWAFGEIVRPMFDSEAPERWIVLSIAFVVAILIIGTTLVRYLYIREAQNRQYTASPLWQLSHMLRSLANITLLSLTIACWQFYRNAWDAPSSIGLLASSFTHSLVLLVLGVKHRRILKRQIELLERTAFGSDPAHPAPPAEEYLESYGSGGTPPLTQRIPPPKDDNTLGGGETLYETAPMMLGNGTDVFRTQRTRIEKPKVPPRKGIPALSVAGIPHSKKVKALVDSPREDSHATSRTSIDDAERSQAMIDRDAAGAW